MPKGRIFRCAVYGLALLGALLFCGGCGRASARSVAKAAAAPTAVASARPTLAPSPTPAPTQEPSPTPAPTQEPVSATVFVPDAFGQQLVRVETTVAGDDPLALIDELVRLGTLPDVDYGRSPYFETSDSFVKRKGKKEPCVVARLDVSERFLSALSDLSQQEELVCLQGLANTFIEYYGAEAFMLTINGDKLVTNVRDYESGLLFDQYVKTAREG